MANEAEPAPKEDVPPIEVNQAESSPDSSPFRPPRTPPPIKRPARCKLLKKDGPIRPSSPEGSSPGFRLHSTPPLLKVPVRRTLFASADPKAEESLKKRCVIVDLFHFLP